MNRRGALGAFFGFILSIRPRSGRAARILVINEQPLDASLEVSYAQLLGRTNEISADIKIEPLANGAAAVAALIGGAVDIGNSNTLSLLVAHDRGFPLVMLAPAALYNSKAPSSIIMVPRDSPLQTAPDFNNKTIAVSGLKDITQYATMAWIDKHGGDSQSLRFVEMRFADMPLALASHRVDAAVIAEPFASRATQARRIVGAYEGIAPQFIIGGWIATRPWVQENTALAQSFCKVIYETAAWANTHHEATAQALLKLTRLNPTEVQTIPRAIFAERFDPALIQPVIDVGKKYGALHKAVSPRDVTVSDLL